MAKLYSNENFYRPVVLILRELGHDVLTSLEAGRANQKIPDEQVLEFAISEERCVLTLNRKHFAKLHLINSEHFGIIACTEDPDFEGLALRIHQVIESVDNNLAGRLIKIYRPNPG
jgi:predicted nuclease of predicted toxin-antitoxin system